MSLLASAISITNLLKICQSVLSVMAITIRLILAYWLISACVDMLPGQYANCFRKPFVEPRKGKRLPVSIIANVTAETIHFCASICLKRSSCQSFNYRRNASTYQCQLNEFDHENNVRDDPNYVYSSIYDWNPVRNYIPFWLYIGQMKSWVRFVNFYC